ncbi:MAG: Extracellular serine protease [Chlamydiae bacterium]|nr:Extracellular serine protease [Chlamydiota bacterium]
MGAAIFITGNGTFDQSDASSTNLAGELQITGGGVSFSGSSLQEGTGGNNGEIHGTDIFMMSGGQIIVSGLTQNTSIPTPIKGDQGAGVSGSSTTQGGITLDATTIGPNTATFTLNGSNTYTGTTEVNSGTLILNGDLLASTPVSVGGSGTFTFGNVNGTFSSFPVTNGNQVNLTTDTGNTSIYGGNISSTGAVTKTGAGIFVLSGNNTYSSLTTISAGTIQTGTTTALSSSSAFTVNGILDVDHTSTIGSLGGSGSVDIAPSATLTVGGNNSSTTFSGEVSGAGTLIKQGNGTLTLSGTNTLSGPTTIDGGILAIDGSLSSSPIMLNNGGRLLGDGILGNLTVDGGVLNGNGTFSGINVISGTVRPGESIGTITIMGNYAQGAGAIYEVEIEGASSDKIIATGTATIDGNAVLTVLEPTGSFIEGTTYNILTASGGINQLWGVINFPNGFSFDLQLLSGNTIAQLTLLDTILFVGQAIDPGNPTATKDYLQCLNILPNSDLGGVIVAADTLSDRDLNKALNQLHPGLFGAFEFANLDNNALITSILAQQMTQLPCSERGCFSNSSSQKKNNLWISPFGNFTDVDRCQQLRGFDTKSGGGAIGYDRCLPNNFLLGVSTGYIYTHLDWDSSAGDTNIQKVFGAIYGGYSIKHLILDASVIGGGNFYDVTRKIKFATINRKAKNNHTGYFVTPHLGAAINFYPRKAILGIFGAFDYFYLHQPSYKESGAGSLNLKVDQKTSQMLRTEFGGKLAGDIALNDNSCIRPFIAVSWVRKMFLSDDKYRSLFKDFSSDDCCLKVQACGKNKNFVSPEAGVFYSFRQMVFSLAYQGEFGNHYHVHQATAKFQYPF